VWAWVGMAQCGGGREGGVRPGMLWFFVIAGGGGGGVGDGR